MCVKGAENVTLWHGNKLCAGSSKGICNREGSLSSCSQHSQQRVDIPFSLLKAQLTQEGHSLCHRGLKLHRLAKVTENGERERFKAKKVVLSDKALENHLTTKAREPELF